ncbi:HAD family hydrolase [Sphingobacterium multivorum]|nr:HAD-IA family hydrolase [Sphingobacterium multivorum]QQT31971.1 HAD family hydrolase [Sphingobacterium multivorum]
MVIDTSLFEHYSFDLWLTLIKSNPHFKQKRNMLLRDFFCVDKKIGDIGKVVRHYDILSNQISEITGKHIDREFIYFLILSELGVDLDTDLKERLTEFTREVDILFWEYKPVLLNDNQKSVFEAIVSKGKTLSLLSNTAFLDGTVLRQVLEYYELSDFFSFQLYSDEIGVSKPNNIAFDLVFQKIRQQRTIKKKDIVHIGDNRKADYNGAINYGFNAILIQ